MDFTLRCNSLKCRTQLPDKAVVTTCSHIFCIPCSENLGLSGNSGSGRICPACHANLNNPDDAVATHLNPTEDYKTSVLSGLSPSIIMECAGRALNLYSYQTTQEIVYQEMLARSLTEKYSTLSLQMDKLIHDANSEIRNLQDKLGAIELEKKDLENKNHDLAEAFREKSMSHQKVLATYQKLKRQQIAFGMERAAQDDAEQTLQAAAGGGLIDSMRSNDNGRHTYGGGAPVQTRGSYGSRGSGEGGGRHGTGNLWDQQAQGTRNGLHSSRSAPITTTPSGHRTRLPQPLYGKGGTATGGQDVRYGPGSPYRQLIGNMDPKAFGGGHSGDYGMSTGVKIGRQGNGPLGRPGVGMGSRAGLSGLGNR